MALSFYMDHNIPRSITDGLKLRGIDVLTAFEDQMSAVDDENLLGRATELNRVLFTADDDFLRIGSEIQKRGHFFSGIIYIHQLKMTIGNCIQQLEIIAQNCEPKDFENQILFLPVK